MGKWHTVCFPPMHELNINCKQESVEGPEICARKASSQIDLVYNIYSGILWNWSMALHI